MRCTEPEIGAALAEAKLQPRVWTLLSSIRSPEIDRAAYRVETQGPIIKARRFESEAAAREQMELRRALPSAFARVFFQHGRVLLEEWIAGRALGPSPGHGQLEEAGALLGNLHGRTSLGAQALHELRPTSEHRSIAVRALRQVRVAGQLPAGYATLLAREMRRLDPGVALHGLAHRDFCGENLVVDTAGRLHVVDNERVDIDALGFDLARTWYRWGLTSSEWARFYAAYASRFPLRHTPESLRFWRLVAVSRAAALRLRVAPERAAVALVRLRALAEELVA